MLKVIQVSDNIYRGLIDRFDRGDDHVYTGKKDGTNRRLVRGCDGLIRGPHQEIVLPRSDVDALPNCKVVHRNDQLDAKVFGRDPKSWIFLEWVYGSTGRKPVGMTYKNCITGKTKTLDLHDNQQPLTCRLCGVPALRLRRCTRCKDARYCCVEHQRLDWKVHRDVCRKSKT